MPKVGLCMIVKNESKVIRRCLDSVKPFVDYVVITDTGSTDDTVNQIEKYLEKEGIEGQVFSESWVNFSENRNTAIKRIMSTDCNYALMLDADEVLVFDDSTDPIHVKSRLSADLYDIETVLGGESYLRPQLFSLEKPFSFRGVVHEFLDCEGGYTRDRLLGVRNMPIQDSFRNESGNKYIEDAKLLKKALRSESDPFLRARYTFYLAQSYRDAGELQLAHDNYLKRASMGFWREEVFVSLLTAAELKEKLSRSFEDVLISYLAAHEVAGKRLEALHGLSRLCRQHKKFASGLTFAGQALVSPKPETGLFLKNWVYKYGILDEYAQLSLGAGNFVQAIEASIKLIQEKLIPPSEFNRVLMNARVAQEQMEVAMSSG